MHKKLFIPGPIEVRSEVLQKMSSPMIGHRDKEFSELFNEIIPKMQKLLYTQNRIFLSTSSGTGLMEAAVRNCTDKKCLNLVCGAFSDRWHGMTQENGKECEAVKVEWGKAIKPEMVREKLDTGEFDAITLVHNETSTGVMNPLQEIAEVMKEFPETLFLVDTVSSMAGVKIEVDKLGIDVCLSSSQKALGLPPGLAVCSVSEKALEKAKTVKNRGHYFDFLAFLKSYEKGQTPTTPCIPHFFALNHQLDHILKEGLDNRFARHEKMAGIGRKWAKENFELFPEKGYESVTLTAVKNNKGIVVADLNAELAKKGFLISNGYKELKEKTFRIAHMGDTQPEELEELLKVMDEIIAGLPKGAKA
ncbi:MAG: alanine--glyoxylate aminotransferase family protein [Candidatus Diapherotrites archaeon]